MILGERSGGGGSSWSRDDDIAFERALAVYTDEDENLWGKIAAVVPGKTLEQVREHYKILVHDVMMIESGCVPLPDYDFANDKEISIWECDSNRKCKYERKGESKLKQRRRKGIPWTANEHRQFLLGLEKYGKGDWRSISRNFVVTRTPTQVASHAQKHFARLNSKNKNKSRPSIHDLTWQNTDQATSQPSSDLPIYDKASKCNTQGTSQPSLDRPVYGAPAIWNTQTTLQPSLDIPSYGSSTPTMVQSMVIPFGSDMNHMAPPPLMAYGVQHYSVPYSSIPSAPINMGSIPYNMTYLPQYRT